MSVFRYQAIGPLQAGEGSRAFLGLAINANDKALPVVIIWVPEDAENDKVLLEKIRRETEHAAKLDHPHIVTVVGFAKLDEGHARVVEFADGESLRKILDACKKMPARLATRVILDACTAIHYAHVAGNDDGVPLVHGDLRPETMLISFQGVTKVTGYGALAFAPRELGGLRVKGRRVHSAPEQIISGRDAVTIATDVYLLGLALYECLTGTVPWADQADFFDHAVLTLPLPPATPGDLPEKFEAIIQKACAKKALDRYPTPLALREALEAAAGDDVATDEELAKFLEELFPQSHELRAARRHTIDAGIADFVRRQWAEQDRRETQPMMRAVQVPASMIPPGIPQPVAAPSVPAAPAPAKKIVDKAWTQVVEEDDEEERPNSGNSTPWLIALAIFVALIAGWWAWTKANAPIPGADILDPPKITSRSQDLGPKEVPPVVEEVDAGRTTETVDAGQTEEPVDAGTAAKIVPPVSSAASEVAVSIDASPPVELLLEGKMLGSTPWVGKLPPGKKVFTLQNKTAGIWATRSVVLRSEPVDERYVFEKGSVVIKAPAGASVFIDGNRIGTAPITGEVPVYEGSHRIQVTIGQSKWSEPFSIYGSQRVSFNVQMQ